MDTHGNPPSSPSIVRRDAESAGRSAAALSLLPDPFAIVGTILDGRYLIERVVGGGGFGIAYRALHLQFDSPVAIKALRLPDSLPAERQTEFIAGFSAEAKVLFRLGSLHPAIVRALETGSFPMADGRVVPYLVMEWLDGAGLDTELQARKNKNVPPFTLTEALALLHPVAEALGAAHEQGIAHRDVKPGNVFLSLTSRGTVAARLLDFGLAKAMANSTSITQRLEDTSGGETPFTPAYGAPEQWLRRLGATGTWTDVYGLALTLVELITGRTALEGNDRGQLMGACLDANTRPTPRTLGLDVKESVERVFRRALAVNPRERYLSAGQMWVDLTAAAGWSPRSHDTQRQNLVAIRMPPSGPEESPTLSSPTAEGPIEDANRNITGTMAVEGRSEVRKTTRSPMALARAGLTTLVVTAAVVLAVSIAFRRASESKGAPPDGAALAPIEVEPQTGAWNGPAGEAAIPAPAVELPTASSSVPTPIPPAPPKPGAALTRTNSANPVPKPPATGKPTGLVQDDALLDRK